MRQKQALSVMMSGANVFLTGAPGAGKTYILNQFIKRAERAGKHVAVTASTGIAASHLGGTTIHSWSGLGILDGLNADDLKRLSGSEKLLKRYNSTDILVIDEVSMLHGARLDMVNQMAKALRSSEAAFGGLQVILVGDLFQLPPVSRGVNAFDFVHLSAAWADLNPRICYITEQHRQGGNDGLLMFLEAMRRADIMEDQYELIRERMDVSPSPETVVTRLYSHNIDVDTINDKHLKELAGDAKIFIMQTKGSKAKLEQLAKGLLVPEALQLKVGAEVMFVANNFAEGFVNGTQGRVIEFDKDVPIVQLMNGRRLRVEPHSWSLNEDGQIRAEVSQLPLRLAWAITIHKSQGMSLDAAEIDLSRAFTPGMGYVALSRVRSLDGLYLKGLNNMALSMHPQIHDLDDLLRDASRELAAITEDIADEVAAEVAAAASAQSVDPALFEALKAWRLQRSRSDGVAPFMIAHNTALEAVASNPPTTQQQLLALPGFGVRKVESYGPDILAVIAAQQANLK
jgi:ATP-dependent DNA helicase PIF1